MTYKLADDANLILSKYGEYLYKNLIIFAPSVLEFGGQVDTESITRFIDDGGNLLVAANAASGDVYREIASESGFEVYTMYMIAINLLNIKHKNRSQKYNNVICKI